MVQTNGRTDKQFKIFAVTYSIGKRQNILIHVPTFFRVRSALISVRLLNFTVLQYRCGTSS